MSWQNTETFAEMMTLGANIRCQTYQRSWNVAALIIINAGYKQSVLAPLLARYASIKGFKFHAHEDYYYLKSDAERFFDEINSLIVKPAKSKRDIEILNFKGKKAIDAYQAFFAKINQLIADRNPSRVIIYHDEKSFPKHVKKVHTDFLSRHGERVEWLFQKKKRNESGAKIIGIVDYLLFFGVRF